NCGGASGIRCGKHRFSPRCRGGELRSWYPVAKIAQERRGDETTDSCAGIAEVDRSGGAESRLVHPVAHPDSCRDWDRADGDRRHNHGTEELAGGPRSGGSVALASANLLVPGTRPRRCPRSYRKVLREGLGATGSASGPQRATEGGSTLVVSAEPRDLAVLGEAGGRSPVCLPAGRRRGWRDWVIGPAIIKSTVFIDRAFRIHRILFD